MPIYMNSVGYAIVLNVNLDITNSTVQRIVYKKPSGATGYWEATLRRCYEIYYLIQEGDFDEVGKWEIQAYVETSGRPLYGERAYLDVEANIGAS
jgi:hypothetical protein